MVAYLCMHCAFMLWCLRSLRNDSRFKVTQWRTGASRNVIFHFGLSFLLLLLLLVTIIIIILEAQYTNSCIGRRGKKEPHGRLAAAGGTAGGWLPVLSRELALIPLGKRLSQPPPTHSFLSQSWAQRSLWGQERRQRSPSRAQKEWMPDSNAAPPPCGSLLPSLPHHSHSG